MEPAVAQYWNEFRAETNMGGTEPYDICKIGDTATSADIGLALIIDGTKTCTSSLPEEFQKKRPPQNGDLSIVLDGSDAPGCVIETTEVNRIPFNEIGEQFARDYGEWDRTLTTWREKNGTYYQLTCKRLGIHWSVDRELICEYFRLRHVALAH